MPVSTGRTLDLVAYRVSQHELRLAVASVVRFGPAGARDRAEAAVLRQLDRYVDDVNAVRQLRATADSAKLPLTQTRRRA